MTEAAAANFEKPEGEGIYLRGSSQRTIENKDSVALYLEEIARTPLLDAEKEVELSKTIEAGLYAERLLQNEPIPEYVTAEELEWLADEGQKAVDTFIESNLRLVVSLARKYGRASMPMLDIIQEGNTGLIRAVEKFDYTKGFKFSTYATWWIRQAITRGISQQARIVRLPVHVVEELNQLGGARRTLERELGRDPEPEEIADELGLPLDRVLNLMDWGREHVSLDTPIGDDGDASLGDLIAQEEMSSPEDAVLNNSQHDELEQWLGLLGAREAEIMRLRYGLVDGRQHNLRDIGERYGISAERIRQLERESLARLKEFYQSEENISQLMTKKAERNPEQKKEAKKPSTRQLGKRALMRFETEQKLNIHEQGLDEQDARVLRAYVLSDTKTAASQKLDMPYQLFLNKLRLAETALNALVTD
jgi:RNA polymerase primary sigma factor